MELQVGVKALLRNSKGKYLLVKRSPKYRDIIGEWDLVGGRINPGSSLLENLSREIKEEVGLDIVSKVQLIAAQDIFSKDKKHVVRLTYTAKAKGTVVLDDNENVEYAWLTLDEIKKHPKLDQYFKKLIANGLFNL